MSDDAPEALIQRLSMYFERAPIGSGQREVLVLDQRAGRRRLFYVPLLRLFTLPEREYHEAAASRRTSELPLQGVARMIRMTRARRRAMAKAAVERGSGERIGWSVAATREVLEKLKAAREVANVLEDVEEAEDEAADTTDGDIDMEGNTVTTEKKTRTRTRSAKPKGEAKPRVRKAAAPKAAKAKAPKAPKAAKAKGEKKGAVGGRVDAKVITVLTKENPRKGERAERFKLLRTGMTIGEYVQACADKLKLGARMAKAEVWYAERDGLIKTEAPKA